MRRIQMVVILALGISLAAAGGYILHQSSQLAEAQREKDEALKALRDSQEALQQSKLRIAASMQGKPAPESDGRAAIAERDATIKRLTDQLNSVNSSLAQLQGTLSASKAENAKELESSNQRFEQMKADLQDRLNKLQQQLDSAQTEVQSSRQRIAELQQANDRLSSSSNEGSARVAQREHILLSLEELDRRRESYLTSIADRYRNLTNQFRTMSGMLTSNRGQDSNSFQGPALDMIQNAISLTDNDLQHLSELNATAYRLEKQLSKP